MGLGQYSMFPKFSQGFKSGSIFKLKQGTSKNLTPGGGASQSDENEKLIWRQFQEWYGSELGQQLLIAETHLLELYLPDLFGYFLLQCGCPEIKVRNNPADWLKSSRVSCKIKLDPNTDDQINCQASPRQLPVKTDNLDIVLLPHVLEFSSSPHQVLREVERVLIPEGHVVILGFNPWSLWNVYRLFMFWKKQAPWNAHFLAASRVMDWLALLGFDVVQRQGYFFRPPLQHVKLLQKMSFLEKMGQRIWSNFGAGYLLVAKKRVETLTPIRPRWSTKPQVIPAGIETMNRNKV